jgi:hypothetical protein
MSSAGIPRRKAMIQKTFAPAIVNEKKSYINIEMIASLQPTISFRGHMYDAFNVHGELIGQIDPRYIQLFLLAAHDSSPLAEAPTISPRGEYYEDAL